MVFKSQEPSSTIEREGLVEHVGLKDTGWKTY